MAAKKKKKTKKVENQNIAEMEQPAVGVSDQAKVDVEERLAKNGIVLQICKREHYIEAWKAMYALDKKKWNDPEEFCSTWG